MMGEQRFSEDWWSNWPQSDTYLASDGHVARIPLRLQSTNLVIYGGADLAEVMKEFEHEDTVPVSVGGRVPVQLWCNNFTDTDCGPTDRTNPYLETWFSFPVVAKSSPLKLPYESPFSLNVEHPDALVMTHRVLCGGDRDGYTVGAQSAISCGREVWGFPKHPGLADLAFDYVGDDEMTFAANHLGRSVYTLRARLPEAVEGHVSVSVDVATGPDTCITPSQNPHKAGFIPKQTRYATAMAATLAFAPWDTATDTLEIQGEDDHFGGLLKSWNFQPELKMHTSDFKVVARKPAGWGAELK
ncbi:hypothetical protein [Paraurantiacibacter namhicola]|uniref:Acetoacetate decarboxylase (ADC) n=1 Tax=Paraurantiacibacter namhicola TaxID=645517 RepID=A0A1C7DAG6_9SPHN|nr:hypothetical protein [Paraurantiacibacter namhicola]ANU08435.1 hypothetical protein A6F65_02149 [Paraurantiacibacter namhicola]